MASSLVKLAKQCLSTIAVHVLRSGPVPRHVALIMDGNRRYAQQLGMERKEGHAKGGETVLQTLDYASKLGIEEVTMYAFSLENFKRTEDEINDIMEVIASVLTHVYDFMRSDPVKANWCFRTIGDLSLLPRKIQELTAKLNIVSQDNARLTINLCIAYTARDDMCLAMRELAEGVNNKEIKESDISGMLFEKCMRTAPLRPVDLLIRTSGEKRLSDFLLWEHLFIDPAWPVFNEFSMYLCFLKYQRQYHIIQKARKEHVKREEQLQKQSDFLCVLQKLAELRGKDTTPLDCEVPEDPNAGIIQSKDFETLVEEYAREREQRIKAFLHKLYKNRNDYIMSFLPNSGLVKA